MILLDAGPLAALFDPRDESHEKVRATLARVREELVTTIPVLTEVFHLLGPATRGAVGVRTFLLKGGARLWWMADGSSSRAFRLMEDYADHQMDLADASLVVAAEELRTTRVFTIDRRDFLTYRARVGRKLRPFTLV
jgi:hypothetical protein